MEQIEICSLTDEIIDAILVRLPIRDAARTSVLSSNWKLKWERMSKLVFNNECLPSPTDQVDRLNKLVHIVDSVLTLHVGPVQRFEFLTDLPICSDVHRWISFLSRNNIKELRLLFKNGAPCTLSSRLFSCEALTFLQLHHCVFKLPDFFQQFAKLTALILSDVHDSGSRLETLISGCPSLKELALVRVEGPGHLNIASGNLRQVYIIDVSCSFTYAPYLAEAIFMFSGGDYEERTKTSDLFSGLHNVQKLDLYNFAIQCFIGYATTYPRLPGSYNYLKTLHIELNVQSAEEYTAALCLLRSFPNLELLDIQALSVKSEDITTINCDVTLNRLKVVKMADIIGTKRELQLIACFLRNAPLLERIMISIERDTSVIDKLEICKDLMLHRRASAKAEIVYMEDLMLQNNL